MSENTFFNVSFITVYVKDEHVIFSYFSISSDSFATFKTKTSRSPSGNVIPNLHNYKNLYSTEKSFISTPAVLFLK